MDPLPAEYEHSALERLDARGNPHAVCASCLTSYPCQTQRIDARYAASDLTAYFARYYPPAGDYAHAPAIAATVAA